MNSRGVNRQWLTRRSRSIRDHRLTGLDYLGPRMAEARPYKRIFRSISTRACAAPSKATLIYHLHMGECASMLGARDIDMITVIIDKESREVEASSPMGALGVLCLRPDSYLILRNNVPIPIDEPLADGDVIRAVRVASGG